MDERPPTVAVWRSLWLPPSETFVRDHVTHLQRWRPLLLGLHRRPGTSIDMDGVHAPFPWTSTGRKVASASYRLGHRGPYTIPLRLHRPELMHAHFGTDAIQALPIARRLRLPLLVTLHGYDVLRAPLEETGKMRRQLLELLDQADLLLPVSGFLAARLEEFGADPNKVRVHHLGIPVPKLERVGEARSGIVFVGRLIARKGVSDLLAAYAALPSDLRKATPVRIVGDGPERQGLEELARSIPEGDVRFLGVLSSDQVREVLEGGSIFVAPSKHVGDGDAEAFGLTFLEAASVGMPVVAYRHAGIIEAVEDGVTGLLAPEGDVGALRDLISMLLKDPLRRASMGDAGRRRVLNDFDLSRQTSKLEDIYDEAVDRCRTADPRLARGPKRPTAGS